jgi:hypothetical protein
MLKKLLLFIALSIPASCWLQTGGIYSFQFLNGHYSARQLGLGDIICISDGDLQSAWSNPATLSKEHHNKALIGQTILAGGINTGALSYGRTIGNYYGSAHFRYVAYGKMKRTDVNGTDLGTFSPGDFIFGASAAKAINERMTVGATLNLLYSQMDQFTAFGGAVDIGGSYRDDEKRIVVAGVVKNLGAQFKGYTETKYALPLEVQLGISHKLKHAPFRFTLVGTNLQKWDLSYNDPNAKDEIDPLTGDTIKVKQAGFFEKLGRHALVQTELLFGKKMHLRFAFDYQRRRELAVSNRPGLAGFSFGAGLYLKRFSLDYGWMIYSAAGSQHGISLTIPLKN